MAENILQLNQSKTEVLVIGPFFSIFDSELSFNAQIKNVTKTGFHLLKNRVRPFLSQADTEVLMHAFYLMSFRLL